MLKVLIVEDDLMLADFAEELLVEHGYKVGGIARTVGDAVARVRHSAPDLVVLDLRLADGGLGSDHGTVWTIKIPVERTALAA